MSACVISSVLYPHTHARNFLYHVDYLVCIFTLLLHEKQYMNIFFIDSSNEVIGHVSLALENEVGANGGREFIFTMLKDRTLFCFWL